MKKISLFTLKVITMFLLTIISFVLFSYIHLSMIRSADLKKQSKRMDKIEKNYDEGKEYSYLDFSEENFDNFPYNEVRFLASHNSYKKKGSIIGKLFVGIGDSFNEAKSLNYSYQTLTMQLQNGIYSLELDLRLRGNNFEVTHVPVVDNSSTIVNFKKGLEEIRYYLDNSSNAFPLLIILEIKDDYMWIDPLLKEIKDEQLIKLEQLLIEVLGDKLYKPSDMTLNYETLMDRVTDIGWPKVSELKGKAIFVIHEGKYANNYNNLKDNKEQVLFTSTLSDNKTKMSAFIIHNSLNVDKINSLVDLGYMVRTRIGNTLGYSEEEVNQAINSKAQILTSDFTIGRSDLKSFFYLKEKYTIIGLEND